MNITRRLIIPPILCLVLLAGCSGQSPEMRQAQEELDEACAEIDVRDMQDIGVPPEEYGCEEDGTGMPVGEWIEQNEGEAP